MRGFFLLHLGVLYVYGWLCIAHTHHFFWNYFGLIFLLCRSSKRQNFCMCHCNTQQRWTKDSDAPQGFALIFAHIFLFHNNTSIFTLLILWYLCVARYWRGIYLTTKKEKTIKTIGYNQLAANSWLLSRNIIKIMIKIVTVVLYTDYIIAESGVEPGLSLIFLRLY